MERVFLLIKRRMTIVCGAFFLSGAAALVFEMLWFHRLGLVFGNSVAATSVVLASFMGGLALGSALMARWGQVVRRPAGAYALLEVVVGASAFLLVLLLPRMTVLFIPLLRPLLDRPLALEIVRGVLAFGLLLIPTTAMGTTLPLLTKAVSKGEDDFGKALGMLYGWNTLGGVCGVLVAQTILIPGIGINASGFFALGCNLAAAALGLWLSRSGAQPAEELPGQKVSMRIGLSKHVMFLLAAGAGAGFVMLAMEVVWFRFMLLFFGAFSLDLAVMLMVVLAGISLGGLLAARLMRGGYRGDHYIAFLCALNAVLLVLTYAFFDRIFLGFKPEGSIPSLIISSLFLMGAISMGSGMLYTFLGRALRAELPSATAAAGWLTLVNTLGGMCGSLAAGVFFIPRMGMERSFFILGCVYAFIALLLWLPALAKPGRRLLCLSSLSLCGLSLALFPFGRMEEVYTRIPLLRLSLNQEKRLSWKEGMYETLQYLQVSLLGAPYYFRLVTDNFSMSTTEVFSQRYMRLYVYLPLALRPHSQDACLIAFGCGTTAQALTQSPALRHIDIIDISPDVLKSSKVVFPDPRDNPLHDPRVTVRIEDGRFYLLTTDRSYDLITAEPPPPGFSKVSNLFSEEYFKLIYGRLKPGGICTYWLPVSQMSDKETRAVMRAFMNAFEHTSLWNGSGYNWMLVGIKPPLPHPDAQDFSLQWQGREAVRRQLHAVGLAEPAMLGGLFIADGKRLRDWVGDAPPLNDNFPLRLYSRWPMTEADQMAYERLKVPQECSSNFYQSRDIAGIWPEPLYRQAAAYFTVPQFIDILKFSDGASLLWCLSQGMREPLLRPYLAWALRSDAYAQEILGKARLRSDEETLRKDPAYCWHAAVQALQDNDLARAEQYLAQPSLSRPQEGDLLVYSIRSYLRAVTGDLEGARGLLEAYGRWQGMPGARAAQAQAVWLWIKDNVTAEENKSGGVPLNKN